MRQVGLTVLFQILPLFCACPALQSAPASEKAMLQQQLEPLMRVAKAHARGPEEYARSIVQEVLSLFADVEEKFQSSSGLTTEQEMIDALRKSYPNDHQAVLDMVISHQGLGHKMELVKRILSTLVLPAPVPYRSLLRRFAALSSKATAGVALRAQQLLVSIVLMLLACCLLVCFHDRVHSQPTLSSVGMHLCCLLETLDPLLFELPLQEVSLLADLRAVVARALSGLDMFSEADGKLSPTVSAGVVTPFSPQVGSVDQ